MNVKDVHDRQNVEADSDRLILMINQQQKLMEKYHEIEAKLRLTSDCPVDLDDSRGQLLLKDFAWRATEEVAESLSALIEQDDPDAQLHAQEEIADAFHFVLEMFILSGGKVTTERGFEEPEPGYDALDMLFPVRLDEPALSGIGSESLEFIRQIGMVCHTLKNKPWKQTQMLTDKEEFYRRMHQAMCQFCRMSKAFGMGPEELFQMYFRKAQVNEFRQRSEY